MAKKYKNYIQNIFEVVGDSATPQFGPKKGDSRTTKQTSKGFVGIGADAKQQIASIIGDKVDDSTSVGALSNMASKAVGKVETDAQGNPIDVTMKDGLGTMSSNFSSLNPVYQALYLTIASELSGIDFGYDVNTPFSLITKTGKTAAEVAKMSDDEIRSILGEVKLAGPMDILLKKAREGDGGGTVTGGEKTTSVADKGHGRLNSLVQTLKGIDQEYFEKNRNSSGQNYGGVKDTNGAIEQFVKGMVTQKTKKKAVGGAVEKAKDAYSSHKSLNLKKTLAALGDTDKVRLQDAVDMLDSKISKLTDPAKIYSLLTDYIKNGDATQKIRKTIQSYYSPLRNAMKKGNVDMDDSLETPVEPTLMKNIIDKIYEVDAEAVHAPQLNTFIEKNYSAHPDVVQHYYKMLKKAGVGSSLPGDTEAPEPEEDTVSTSSAEKNLADLDAKVINKLSREQKMKVRRKMTDLKMNDAQKRALIAKKGWENEGLMDSFVDFMANIITEDIS